MNCTQCGGKTETLDTRHDKTSNTLKRRRQCRVCGHRFATEEKPLPVAEKSAEPAKAKPAKIAQQSLAPRKEREKREKRESAALLDSSWYAAPARLNSLEDLDYL